MTKAAFLLRYPEFLPMATAVDPATDIVDACLAEADLELTDAGDWGSVRDTAQGLLTADKLWNSPKGATLRLDGGDKEQSSRYGDAFRRLRAGTMSSFLVT